MKKRNLLIERFQKLAGMKPLYSLNEGHCYGEDGKPMPEAHCMEENITNEQTGGMPPCATASTPYFGLAALVSGGMNVMEQGCTNLCSNEEIAQSTMLGMGWDQEAMDSTCSCCEQFGFEYSSSPTPAGNPQPDNSGQGITCQQIADEYPGGVENFCSLACPPPYGTGESTSSMCGECCSDLASTDDEESSSTSLSKKDKDKDKKEKPKDKDKDKKSKDKDKDKKEKTNEEIDSTFLQLAKERYNLKK